MNTNSRILRLITFSYIYLPVMLFLIGYTKLWIWLVTSLVMIIYLVKMYKAYNEDTNNITISWISGIIIGFIIVIFCIYIGYGGIMTQAGDWAKHNAILHDLTKNSWPVYYSDYEESMLTYYLGQYIVPAIIGKISIILSHDVSDGFNAANVSMAVWGIIGIYLVFVNLVRITKSDTIFKQFRCVAIMLLFCGALPLAQLVISGIYGDNMYSQGNYHWILYNGLMMQYRSNTVMLRWVFPQVIVIWLIVILFLENANKFRFYVLLFAPVLIYGSFSIVLLAFISMCYAFYCTLNSEYKKTVIGDIVSLDNILCMLTLGMVLISYFSGYLQVAKPQFMAFEIQISSIADIAGIIVFDLTMFGLYAICVYKEQKSNPLFYLCVVVLSLIPCFKMGLFNDFVMGASIPGLFMIMIWVIQTLNENNNSKNYGIRFGIIMLVLMIGAWYPLMEIRDNIRAFIENGVSGTEDSYGSLGYYSDRESQEQQDLVYNYFTYDLDGKMFYEYFAKNKIK